MSKPANLIFVPPQSRLVVNPFPKHASLRSLHLDRFLLSGARFDPFPGRALQSSPVPSNPIQLRWASASFRSGRRCFAIQKLVGGMGKLGAFAAILIVFAALAASEALARVLLVDSEITPAQSPNANNISKSDLSRPAQKPDKKSSIAVTSSASPNTTQSGSHPNPPPTSGSNSTDQMHATPGGDSVGGENSGGPGKPVENSAEASSGSHEPREAKNPPPDKGKNGDGKEVGSPIKSASPTNKGMKDQCDSLLEKCLKEDLTVCLRHEPTKSLLVQNTGESSLEVTIKAPSDIIVKSITLPANGSQEVILTHWKATDIIISAGKGDCHFHITTPTYNWNPFQQLPTPTPIYGAYFLLFIVFLSAGIWACCKFKKGRRHDSDVPYQQLEMGALPQTNSAVEEVNDTAGWDDGWDDDWDDEQAVGKPSKEHQSNGVSSEVFSSKAPNKDGWDDDWDD